MEAKVVRCTHVAVVRCTRWNALRSTSLPAFVLPEPDSANAPSCTQECLDALNVVAQRHPAPMAYFFELFCAYHIMQLVLGFIMSFNLIWLRIAGALSWGWFPLILALTLVRPRQKKLRKALEDECDRLRSIEGLPACKMNVGSRQNAGWPRFQGRFLWVTVGTECV